MFCKYCGAEQEEGSVVCTACGEVLAERGQKKSRWKIIAAVSASILLLGALVVAVLWGMGVELGPGANDVFLKDSYSVEDSVAVKNAADVIAEVNGQKLTVAEFQAHYVGNIYQFLEGYGTNYFDFSKPLNEQIFSEEEGMTWQQYFVATALENWHRYQILCALAQEDGFVADLSAIDTIPEDLETAAIQYGFESAEDMIHADMGNACDMNAYIAYVALHSKGNQYVSHLYDKWAPTAEDLETYYKDNEDAFKQSGITKDYGNIADVRHILIMPAGEKTDGKYSDAQWQEAYDKAEQIFKEWKAGDATEESFAELANTYSEDGGSNTVGGLYEGIMPDSNYVEQFLNWSIDPSRKVGDAEIVETDFGYHIMYYVSGEPVWMAAARENILPDKLNALIQENTERWPMEVSYSKIVVTDTNVQ